ncbi:putative membrane protein YiaA [Halarchaeum rubridurum]|uniref:Putative membrane protein YiaA n=1 Tax=Halarchaeum rubridurum TaxID=489911 RepID=A0A830FP58_9EURY|nr:hypothetical protein [Halarchaeum rubridurum]MBP1954038.1 putative membrane protein YiaA [Halarchaeum rubridurum]GGM56839.1 hypothetical protein GCM10009017_03770 [Halarchaeum rubridurum]
MAADGVLVLVSLLWGVLGLACGAHAATHERNGPFWFLAVALSGVVGACVYGVLVLLGRDDTEAVDVDDPVTMTGENER